MDGLLGVFLALFGAFATAGQALAIRLATHRSRMVSVLVINLSVTAVILTALSVVFVTGPAITTVSLLAFIVSGVVSLLLGRAFYFAGIQRVGASRAESIKGSMPLFATLFAVVILGERTTGGQVVGILLIVVGIALVSWEGASRDRIAGNDVPWVGLALPLVSALLFGIEPIFASIGFRTGTTPLIGGTIMTVSSALVLSAYLAWRDSPDSARTAGDEIRNSPALTLEPGRILTPPVRPG